MQAPSSALHHRAASSSSAMRPSCFTARGGARQQRTVQAAAAAAGGVDAVARRQALLLLGAGALLSAPASPALAAFDRTPTVCADQETGEAADECRARILARDGPAGQQVDYNQFEGRSARLASGVPVSKIDDEYTRATLELADKLEAYFTLDPYDKARPPLIKAIKADSQAWVTKYARGGSVRKQSARRFYIAVDAVLGFFASNGLAPFPPRKAATVRTAIDETKALLAEAK
ncbi:MAG: photosystem II Pbs27-domain-containing protein [Monoraphidium minutum]|nr:MAG: photosystem II Pbs27-domain-containing protein [Monoraphidium minutum]